ncbi:phosphotransferase family protein [Purpureocillium lilacinum]|uniref:Phosphotransferase family protein n=1 Tax=Purpureocillium lilacinum TaxID=33203 RepID=A0A179G9J7_PURLI|nr:phosphotransferase family protein [Purpureocillium lilacinum]GJN71062.1 hypothetical protein PLICBS_005124 [Purpureocillium lilacinum]
MEPSPVIISPECLPSGSSVTFRDSGYFSRNGHDANLPSPSEVLAASAAQHPPFDDKYSRALVWFRDLGLLVKYGWPPKVTVAEGQCLWALRRNVPRVPVPEIYGWVEQEGRVFLFMELVNGVMLEERLSSLTQEERSGICESLRSMLTELHRLRQEPGNAFVGDISRGPLGDIVFTNGSLPRGGPFTSVKEFHDWLSAMIKWGKEQHWPGVDPADIPDPYRQRLPDESSIVFTHAHLHPTNIMISRESPCQIVAIVDWQQSGWYPDYWEFCKAEFAVHYWSEWAQEYVPRFLKEPSCVETFLDYARAYGY